MDKLKDILVYLLREYPYSEELSKARVTKMVYLADWKSVLDHGNALTSIEWYFDNYGPYVSDVYELVAGDESTFAIENTNNLYGEPKTIFRLKNVDCETNLEEQDTKILKHVIATTKDLNWNQFIKLIYSTYPILSSDKYNIINLKEKAEEYKKENEELRAALNS